MNTNVYFGGNFGIVTRWGLCALLALVLLAWEGAQPAGASVTAIITGTVRHTISQAPIAGATVSASAGCPNPSNCTLWKTTTDERGHYSLYVPEGYEYVFFAEAVGYVDIRTGFTWVAQGTQTVDLQLDAAAVVKGRIYQSDGVTPLAGAEVTICHDGYMVYCGTVYGQGVSDANGFYTTTDFSGSQVSGSYMIRAKAAGYATQYYNHKPTRTSADLLELNVNTVIENINFSLARSGKPIRGHVYAADGVTPIPSAVVFAYDARSSLLTATGYTQSDGSFVINQTFDGGDLPSGPYHVRAEKEGYQTEYYRDTLSWETATTVNVLPDREADGVNFTLDTAGGISGIIYKPDGVTPVAGAQIKIYSVPWAGYAEAEAVSQPDGSFTSGPLLTNGTYYLWYDAAGYLSEWYENRAFSYNATPIQVVSPHMTPITLVARLISAISGFVYLSDGVSPRPNYTVCVESVDETQQYHQEVCDDTDAKGAYEIKPLGGGDYILFAYHNPSIPGLPGPKEYYPGKSRKADAQVISLPPGVERTDLNFAPHWDNILFFPFGLHP